MKLQGVKTVYFDYDGTLHNSIITYAPAFRKGYEFLVKNNKAPEKYFEDAEIQKWLGYTNFEMWEKFMGHLEEDYKRQASKIIGEEMERLMFSGQGQLYENAEHVLMELKKRGYTLVFLSNCSNRYMDTACKVYKLDQYFDDMICCQMHDYIPKHEILKKVKPNFPVEQVIVGDRFHDMESGIKNGIYSIFCEYGFGKPEEGKDASFRIKNISELLNIL